MIEVSVYRRDGSVRALARVDDGDAAVLEHRWHLSNRGYVKRTLYPDGGGQVAVFLHRVVMGLEHGDLREVDHENGDKLDCRRSNLRVCTHAENMQNLHTVSGLSKYRGVSWYAKSGKWRASARIAGCSYSLGLYWDEQDAARAAAAFRAAHMPFSAEAAA